MPCAGFHSAKLHLPAAKISVELPAPPTGGNSGICNSYLPSESVFNRFMYVVQFLTRNGFYVLLDNQINFDTTAVDNTAGWLQVRSSLSCQEQCWQCSFNKPCNVAAYVLSAGRH
jgi:hypothetical protein